MFDEIIIKPCIFKAKCSSMQYALDPPKKCCVALPGLKIRRVGRSDTEHCNELTYDHLHITNIDICIVQFFKSHNCSKN